MKTIVLLLSGLLGSLSLLAQYTTPGNGNSYTLNGLVTLAPQTITQSDGKFYLLNNLTISANDTLKIVDNDTILVSPNVLITVQGVMLCTPPIGACFRAANTSLYFTGFRFENSNGSKINRLSIEHAGGNKVISSDIEFRQCTFYKNSFTQASGALDIFGCNPLIYECTFIENQRSAILTAVNANASPRILNSTFIRNSTLNTNRPQINLGAGDPNMPLIVRGNHIEGGFSAVGGISVFMLAGTMSVLIDSNTVINNRYGINIQGNGITYAITNNQILNNNLEVNPMNGGSGISLNGLNLGFITNNVITGNLWGVTILNGASPNLGKIEPSVQNPGLNRIFNNGNNNLTYNLYNNTANEIFAQNNYWGTNDPDSVELGIWHNPDNSSLGIVHYLPIYQISSHKEILSYALTNGNEQFEGIIEGYRIDVTVPEGTDVSNLRALFTLSSRALAYVNGVLQIPGITENNFTEPVVYTVVAEDGSSADYTVYVSFATQVNTHSPSTLIYPNPIRNTLAIISSENIEEILIHTINGITVEQKSCASNCILFDTSHLTPGIYILELRNMNSIERKVVIKN